MATLHNTQITPPRPILESRSFKPQVQKYVHCGSTVILFCPSSNGKVFGVRIDADDLPRVLAAGPWSVANFGKNGSVRLYCYSRRRGPDGKTLYLHRLVMDAPDNPSIEVDHTHNRSLDSRKGELRLVSKSLNQRNKGKSGPPNKFGLRGVIATRSGRYSAKVWKDSKSKILGTFDEPSQAGECVRQFLIAEGADYAAQQITATARGCE